MAKIGKWRSRECLVRRSGKGQDCICNRRLVLTYICVPVQYQIFVTNTPYPSGPLHFQMYAISQWIELGSWDWAPCRHLFKLSSSHQSVFVYKHPDWRYKLKQKYQKWQNSHLHMIISPQKIDDGWFFESAKTQLVHKPVLPSKTYLLAEIFSKWLPGGKVSSIYYVMNFNRTIWPKSTEKWFLCSIGAKTRM